METVFVIDEVTEYLLIVSESSACVVPLFDDYQSIINNKLQPDPK